jgi:RNA polymerase sigma factor (sigma-70 family)
MKTTPNATAALLASVETGRPPRVTLLRDGRVCPLAFKMLMALFERQVRKIGSDMAAGFEDDVVQDTFIRVYENATAFDRAETQIGLIYRIARNAAAEVQRAEVRARRAATDEARARRLHAKAEERRQRDEERAELLDVIAFLSETDRKVLRLRLDGNDAAEAAAVLGLTEAAYRARLSRATVRLVQRMNGE